jgi:hypothetical protein
VWSTLVAVVESDLILADSLSQQLGQIGRDALPAPRRSAPPASSGSLRRCAAIGTALEGSLGELRMAF